MSAFKAAQQAPPPLAAAFKAAEQGNVTEEADPLLTTPARLAGLAESLKARGNAHYARGDDGPAVEDYTAGLRALGEQEHKTLRGALLSNRAAVRLRRGEHELCVQDCDAALKLDAGRAKCYYRRAAANEAQEKLEQAFKDLKVCVQLEPANKAAVVAARRVKDKLTQQLGQDKAFGTPAERLALQICQCVETEELDARKMANLFKAGASLALDDEAAAKALWRGGAGDAACAHAKAKGAFSDVRKAAVCMLGAMAHRTAISEPSMAWQVAGVLRREGEGFFATDAADAVIALCAAVVDSVPGALVRSGAHQPWPDGLGPHKTTPTKQGDTDLSSSHGVPAGGLSAAGCAAGVGLRCFSAPSSAPPAASASNSSRQRFAPCPPGRKLTSACSCCM